MSALHVSLRVATRIWETAIALVVGVYLVLIVALLALRYVLLPQADTLRPWIEQQVGQAIGLPLHIGAVQTQWSGLMPQFTLRNVRVDAPDGTPALQLAEVQADPSWTSLPRLTPIFDRIVVRGADFTLTRPDPDHLELGGLRFALSGGSGDTARAFADWLLRQHEVALLDSRLTWIDQAAGAPPLPLTRVNLVLRNGFIRHRAALTATPSPAIAGPIDLRADFRQPLLARHPSDVQQWRGQVYALLPDAQLAAVQSQVPLHNPWPVQAGAGSLRVWLEVDRGRPEQLTADLALRDARVQTHAGAPPLALQSLSGRVQWTRLAQGERVALRRLALRTAAGAALAPTDALWQQQLRGGQRESSLLLTAADLGALARLAEALPLPAPWPARLQQLQPQGRVRDVEARWSAPVAAQATASAASAAVSLPPRYSIKAQFSDLGWRSPAQPALPADADAARWREQAHALAAALQLSADIPGAQGLSGQIDASQDGGTLSFTLGSDGGIDLPLLYQQPLRFSRLAADVRWVRGSDGLLRVQTRQLNFDNADLAGSASVSWRQARDGLGQLDLDGRLTRADARAVWRYLPIAVDAHARDYLRSAIAAGSARDVRFAAHGPVADFPYDQPGKPGEFTVQADITGGVFNAAPRQPLPRGQVVQPDTAQANSDWPVFRRVGGRLTVTGRGLSVQNARAEVLGARLSGIDANLPSFHDAILSVRGQAQADAAAALRYLTASPIDTQLDHLFAPVKASGPLRLDLALQLPLHDLHAATVEGTAKLAGVDVRWRPGLPRAADVTGTVQFHTHGFDLDLRAPDVLGGPLRLSGGEQPGQPLALTAQGRIDAAALRASADVPGWLRSLGQVFSGQTAYTVDIHHTPGSAATSYTLRSDLQGMAVDLPAPLGKAAATPGPLMMTATPAGGGDLSLQLSAGDGQLRAAYVLGPPGADGQRAVRSGGIALGPDAPLPQPAQGVQANVRLPALDVDQWTRAIERLRPAATGGTTGGLDPQALLPTTVALDVGRLTVMHRVFDRVVVGAQHSGNDWRANIDAQQLSGFVSWQGAAGGGPGAITARLARLTLPKSSDADVDRLLDEQPSSIPALDISAEQVDLHGHRFSDLQLQAVNRGSGAQRAWQLTRFSLRGPGAVLTGSGSWSAIGEQLSAPGQAPAGPARRTRMRFDLAISNAGEVLAGLGKPGLIRGGKGSIRGELAWIGSPLALDYPTLSGDFTLALGSGQFLKADPGIAKLLGVLSLQSIPRRFTLDFRDLFASGFAFDSVDADVSVQSGVARTDDFRMRGVSATVRISGSANLAQETQNLRVVVIPEINAGAASLAYALVNPVVGLGTFLAQMIAREPLARALTHVYDITGTWLSPEVKDVSLPAPPATGSATPSAP